MGLEYWVVSAFAPRWRDSSRAWLRPGLRGCHHPHELRKPILMAAPALRQRQRLVTVRLRSEKGPELIQEAAKTPRGRASFEPTGGPVPWLDAPMVLLAMVLQRAIRPGRDPLPEPDMDCTGGGLMAISGDPVGCAPRHGPCRTEARLGCREMPCRAEPHVHAVASASHRAIEIRPPPVNTPRGLIHLPAGSHPAVAPLAQGFAPQGGQRAFPVT